MANSYFQFKQFRITQDQTAMKVCTDACVLGAYANVSGAQQILDIGTGTGLLALMAAQRNETARIDAVELDEEAYWQASENVSASPWKDRIALFHSPIQAFLPPFRYDVILSNPPFFQNHLKRPLSNQNIALHGEALSFPELVGAVNRLLHPWGRFVVLLPPYQSGQLATLLAASGLFPLDTLILHDRIGGKAIRHITTYSAQPGRRNEQSLFIQDSAGAYTEAFVQLLKPYYLYL